MSEHIHMPKCKEIFGGRALRRGVVYKIKKRGLRG